MPVYAYQAETKQLQKNNNAYHIFISKFLDTWNFIHPINQENVFERTKLATICLRNNKISIMFNIYLYSTSGKSERNQSYIAGYYSMFILIRLEEKKWFDIEIANNGHFAITSSYIKIRLHHKVLETYVWTFKKFHIKSKIIKYIIYWRIRN